MGENSSIEWTDHTFNPWWGCTKVSPGCDRCYAETLGHRFGVRWGPLEARREPSFSYWDQPLRWNAKAERDGVRRRVFCASMADVFDTAGPVAAREWLFEVIEETPHLDWLLLTKRIGNATKMMPERWLKDPRPNVWLGATVVNQEEADRDIPKLLDVPATLRFLSCEPLLGPVDLEDIPNQNMLAEGQGHLNVLRQYAWECTGADYCDTCSIGAGIDWVIVGGESGHGARPFTLGWGKYIVRQCRAARVPVFIKQVGANPVNREGARCPHIRDRKGKVMEEWPEELRVREFPMRTGGA
jgi:protein gp37